MRPAIEALGDDADELFGIIEPWGARDPRSAAATSRGQTS